jgi:hypothetical protein
VTYRYPTLEMKDPLGFTRARCERVLQQSPSMLHALSSMGLAQPDEEKRSGTTAKAADVGVVPILLTDQN